MTLKNAQRRFADLGYECEKDVAPYKYKARMIGTTAWTIRASDLDWMLTAAANATTKKAAG